MHSLLISLLMAALAEGAFAQRPPPPTPLPSVALPPYLDRVLRDYERAWQAHDPKALADLFAEDGFVLSNGHPPVRGREAIRTAYSGAGGTLSLRALAYATAGDIGYIIGAFGRAPDAPDSGKFTLTVRRVSGTWAIESDMDNPNELRSWHPEATQVVPSALPTAAPTP